MEVLNLVKSQPEHNKCQSLMFSCVCTATPYSSSERFISVCPFCFVLSTLGEMNTYVFFNSGQKSHAQNVCVPIANSSNPPGGHALTLGIDLVSSVLIGNGE